MKLNKIWLQLGLINLLSVLTLSQETPGGSLPNSNPANPNQNNNNNNPDPSKPTDPNQNNNNNNPDPAKPNQENNNNNPDPTKPANSNQGNDDNNRHNIDNENNDEDDDDGDNRDSSNNGIRNDPSIYSGLPTISPLSPLWSQNYKSAPVSLSRPVFFKWEYKLKPRNPPISLTLTLTEKRDVLYTYEITTEISPKDTVYIWDVTKYRPSDKDGHTINLIEGHVYVVYLHDSRMKFNTLYSKGMYRSARYTISFYRPIDPSNPFGDAPKLTPPRSTVFLLISITILLPFLH